MKHAILKLIMKKRQGRKFSFYAVVNRLIAMSKEEGLSWKEIKYKIDNKLFPTEAIDIAQLIHSKEVNNPILK